MHSHVMVRVLLGRLDSLQAQLCCNPGMGIRNLLELLTDGTIVGKRIESRSRSLSPSIRGTLPAAGTLEVVIGV